MASPLSPLAASETVYFHAERFAREKKLLDSTALLHTEKKFDLSELAEAILAAAFVDAKRTGAVRLSREKVSRLFGLRKVDALVVNAGPTEPPEGSFETRIRGAVEKGPQDVERVVRDVLGQDHTAPHTLVLGGVLDGLAHRGLLETRERQHLKVFRTESYHLPETTRELGARSDGAAVRAQLDAWRSRPDWPLLEKGIRKGIASRQEASDGPD